MGCRLVGSWMPPAGQPMTMHRVLVVDDDDHIREVATMALEIVAGWHVVSAGSGEDATAIARAEQPDVILLDVMMPGVDGPSTVAKLRADPATATIPVVFLTAKTMSVDREEWTKLDLAGMIAKPFDPMTLAAHVADLLGWTG